MVIGGRVDIVDMSADSLGIEHDFELHPGFSTFLEFWWGEAQIRLSCEVARTRRLRDQPDRYRSGLTINAEASETIDDYRTRIEAALEQLRATEEKLPPPM